MRGVLNRRYCQLSLTDVTQDSSCLNMGAKLKMVKEFTPMQRQNSTIKVIARIYKNVTWKISTVFWGVTADEQGMSKRGKGVNNLEIF